MVKRWRVCGTVAVGVAGVPVLLAVALTGCAGSLGSGEGELDGVDETGGMTSAQDADRSLAGSMATMDAAMPTETTGGAMDAADAAIAPGLDAGLVDGLGSLACMDAMNATKVVLTDRCAACHSAERAMDRDIFATVLDADALKDSGKVVAGDPGGSPLLARIEDKTMPPNPPSLDNDQRGAIRAWIACGAPSWAAPAEIPVDECARAPETAEALFIEYCHDCHAATGTDTDLSGGFVFSDNVPAMWASPKDLLVPGDPEGSTVFARLSNNALPMPPNEYGKDMSPPEVAAVRHWIECGAEDWAAPKLDGAFEFVSIDDRLAAIQTDLDGLDSEAEQLRARYIDLSHLANAGLSGPQVQVYREAVSMLANSLSRERNVVAAHPVDTQSLIYRIDLADYGWDSADWERIEVGYPYAVRYAVGSGFASGDTVAEAIRVRTGAQIPYVQGDWFISHASRAAVYAELLDLPDNLSGIEAQLAVDLEGNLAGRRVARAGFALVGDAQPYRIVERHAVRSNQGALWGSYDFRNELREANIFGDPLGHRTEGAYLFSLPNGLLGYFLADAQGNLLDSVADLRQDPLTADGALENGLSCLNCHQERGVLVVRDEIRRFVAATTGDDDARLAGVTAIYPEAEDLEQVFQDDTDRYVEARNRLGLRNLSNTTFHTLNNAYQGAMRLNLAAATLGLTALDLARALEADPSAFPEAVRALDDEDGTIERAEFNELVGEVFVALSLGEPIAALPSP